MPARHPLVYPLLVSLVGAVACKEPASEPQDTDRSPTDTDPIPTVTDTDTDTVTSSTGHTGATSTGTTGDTGPAELIVDCAALPAAPLSLANVAGRGYHDVAFDLNGNIIGSDGVSLISSSYDGIWSVFVPGINTVQGMDWLPNGDLVVASDWTNQLVRITPAGAFSTLATDSGAYGVVVGNDGMIYTANYSAIERIDPYTGEHETLVDEPGLQPRVLNFSPDYSRMYIGTLSGNGAVYVVDLDGNLNPLGPPSVFATGVGSGAYHDALGVDICGNLYMTDYSTNNMYKITSTGTVSLYVDFNFTNYAHGLEWGSGIGDWKNTALYLPQPYNGDHVIEIDIGVPSRTFTGTVINN